MISRMHSITTSELMMAISPYSLSIILTPAMIIKINKCTCQNIELDREIVMHNDTLSIQATKWY